MTMPDNGDTEPPYTGYQPASCPECSVTYLYPESADRRPMCGRCGLRMQPGEAVDE